MGGHAARKAEMKRQREKRKLERMERFNMPPNASAAGADCSTENRPPNCVCMGSICEPDDNDPFGVRIDLDDNDPFGVRISGPPTG